MWTGKLVVAAADDGGVGGWVRDRTGSDTWADLAEVLVDKPLRIVLIWLGAWLLTRILRRIIQRFSDGLMDSADNLRKARTRAPGVLAGPADPSVRSRARAATITSVLRGIVSGIVYLLAVIYSLEVLGVNLGPLIAGAGIAGIALGFGAQSLVRDFLAGTFILIEDQYGVGDVVDLGDAVGTVEAVNLRTTRLRDVNGTVWHVPNGEIVRVGNKSQQWARALLDIVVAHGTDVDQALAVLGRVADEVAARPDIAPDVLEQAEVWGVEQLSPVGITLRVVIKTRPGTQWKVMRALRREIRAALEGAGIEMSVPVVPVQPET